MTENYHFIGIGGIGMSALAHIMIDKQIAVSGSDLNLNQSVQKLIDRGASVQKGHCDAHIKTSAPVVVSSSISKTNPEYLAALARDCQILHRSELLAQMMKGYQSLVVTGTHGKTTTSALLAHVFMEAGEDPTFAVGGLLEGKNGRLGKGPYFIAEGDESDGTFLNYSPDGAIVTNVEPEHMEHFKTEKQLHDDFQTFFDQVKHSEHLFYCGDNAVLRPMAQGRGVSYGFGSECALHLSQFVQTGWSITFNVTYQGNAYQNLTLPMVGRYNALNAAAVFGLALSLGLSEVSVRKAFLTFPGVGRRAELKRETKEVLFLDDYAHHPTEIVQTLRAIKTAVGDRRLVAIFQPHRYTRFHDHWADYLKAFTDVDQLFVTDVYSAGESPIEGVSAKYFVEAMVSQQIPCDEMPSLEAFQEVIRPHDVVVTVGAGDITKFHNTPMAPKKLKIGVIFGGQSCEHEISLRSARFVTQSLNPDLYEVHYLAINPQGEWSVGEEAKQLCAISTTIEAKGHSLLDPKIAEALLACDLLFPILHGPKGEDGSIQGLFEMLNKPYVGPNLCSAAISMNKVLTKKLIASQGVPTPPHVSFSHYEWRAQPQKCLQEITQSLAMPVYVKPTHLGSSIGISKVDRCDQLDSAIEEAFTYDTHVMVEQGIEGARELEFAVVGNENGVFLQAPAPGEKCAGGAFMDYEKKYGDLAVSTTVHPDLDLSILKEGQELALKAYRALESSGMTRVDFLLDAENRWWCFEMNSIPGMQPLSLFPKVWEREGISMQKLLDKLVILSLQQHEQKKRHFALPQTV